MRWFKKTITNKLIDKNNGSNTYFLFIALLRLQLSNGTKKLRVAFNTAHESVLMHTLNTRLIELNNFTELVYDRRRIIYLKEKFNNEFTVVLSKDVYTTDEVKLKLDSVRVEGDAILLEVTVKDKENFLKCKKYFKEPNVTSFTIQLKCTNGF